MDGWINLEIYNSNAQAKANIKAMEEKQNKKYLHTATAVFSILVVYMCRYINIIELFSGISV